VRVELAFLENQGRVRNKMGAGSRWGPWSFIEGLVGDGREVKEGVERYIELKNILTLQVFNLFLQGLQQLY
jgi:hypothetical protein